MRPTELTQPRGWRRLVWPLSMQMRIALATTAVSAASMLGLTAETEQGAASTVRSQTILSLIAVAGMQQNQLFPDASPLQQPIQDAPAFLGKALRRTDGNGFVLLLAPHATTGDLDPRALLETKNGLILDGEGDGQLDWDCLQDISEVLPEPSMCEAPQTLWAVSRVQVSTTQDLVVGAFTSKSRVDEIRYVVRRASHLTIGPMALLSGVVAWFVAWWIRRPIIRTARTAQAIGAGDLGRRVKVRGRDELATLGRSVNLMADELTGRMQELEEAERVQRQFVSDVAHELRTPTASLLAAATALENPMTRDEAAVRIAPELRRLAGLTEDLLEISRFDAGRQELRLDRVELGRLVREVAARAGGAEVSVNGEVTTVADPRRVAVIVRNLICNGHVHGADPVRVRVSRRRGGARIAVTDAGAGVPPELRGRLFDRFVQGDTSRHGTGTGLGLAIARENAELHGGTLTLAADGRTFVLDLPGRPECDDMVDDL